MDTNVIHSLVNGPNLTTPTLLLEALCQLVDAVGAHQSWLYGSRAKGTALPRSDFDIAVSGVSDIEVLEDAVEELPTLYGIDLLNLDTCTNEVLIEEVLTHGHDLHEEVAKLH